MLGFIIKGLLLAATAATIAAVVIYIHGTITREKIRQELWKKGIDDDVLIREIDRCENTITLDELNGSDSIEVHGDDIDYGLYEGERIYV